MDDHPQRITALEVKMDRIEGDTREIRSILKDQRTLIMELRNQMTAQTTLAKLGAQVLMWIGGIASAIMIAWASSKWF